MTPDQARAARELLGWGLARLSGRSGTSINTVRTFERTGRVATMFLRTGPVDAVAAIRATLEEAGVEFTDGDAPGVRLRAAHAGPP